MKKVVVIVAGVVFAVFYGIKIASAGPIIIDGNDGNHRGNATGGVNQSGWDYMQDVLEHLSQQVYTGTAHVVVDLGTTDITPCPDPTELSARQAIDSAFNLSSLSPLHGGDWTLVHEDSAVSITNWLNNLSITNTGILYIPTYNSYLLPCGELTSAELDAINAHAATIANFVNGSGDPAKGGALWAMAERDVTPTLTSLAGIPAAGLMSVTPARPASTNAYGWLLSTTGVIPTGAQVTLPGEDPPITLTVRGSAIFTDIQDGELFADNWFVGNLSNFEALGTIRDQNNITQAAIISGSSLSVPTVPTATLQLSAASDVGLCALPGSSYLVTWTVANVGSIAFPGGAVNTLVTGSGSGPSSTAIPPIPASTIHSVTTSVTVSEPVVYGSETVTVTGNILTSTAVLVTHICAPDFRTSKAHVVSKPVFAGEGFTYTWQISNTGDAAALGVMAALTLPTMSNFTFLDALTSTSGTAAWNPVSHTVTWTGNVPIGASVTIIFTAQSDFGLPHGLIEAPFEVDHSYRPFFLGAATYDYPYKLFFMLVLKDASPTVSRAPGR